MVDFAKVKTGEKSHFVASLTLDDRDVIQVQINFFLDLCISLVFIIQNASAQLELNTNIVAMVFLKKKHRIKMEGDFLRNKFWGF